MTLELLPRDTPFRVSEPVVAELLLIVSALVLADVISIAPMESDAVVILIPAVVAEPAFWNSATLPVSHWAEVVLGVQLVLVYHAVAVAPFVHTILETVNVAL